MTWRHWRDGDRSGWSHRPWWKVAINTALRFVQQRGPGRKLVVFTRVDDSLETPTQPPRVLGYGFGRVMHLAIVALLLAGCRYVAGYENAKEQQRCRDAGGRVEYTYCPPGVKRKHRAARCDWRCADVPPGSWR